MYAFPGVIPEIFQYASPLSGIFTAFAAPTLREPLDVQSNIVSADSGLAVSNAPMNRAMPQVFFFAFMSFSP